MSVLNNEGGVFMSWSSVLGPSLGRAAHLARASMDARMSRYEMTPAQSHVLMYLCLHGKQAPQCEVTAHLRVKPSTANGVLDRMVDKGLVERSVSGSDARRRLITITEKGLALQEQSRRSFQEVEEVIVRGLTAEEVDTFRSLLDRITRNLEEDQTAC